MHDEPRSHSLRPVDRLSKRQHFACSAREQIGSGISGYERFREVLADPTDEEHEHYWEWVGGTFDPELFDLAPVNALLQRVH